MTALDLRSIVAARDFRTAAERRALAARRRRLAELLAGEVTTPRLAARLRRQAEDLAAIKTACRKEPGHGDR